MTVIDNFSPPLAKFITTIVGLLITDGCSLQPSCFIAARWNSASVFTLEEDVYSSRPSEPANSMSDAVSGSGIGTGFSERARTDSAGWAAAAALAAARRAASAAITWRAVSCASRKNLALSSCFAFSWAASTASDTWTVRLATVRSY
jgi:hypothetical protein